MSSFDYQLLDHTTDWAPRAYQPAAMLTGLMGLLLTAASLAVDQVRRSGLRSAQSTSHSSSGPPNEPQLEPGLPLVLQGLRPPVKGARTACVFSYAEQAPHSPDWIVLNVTGWLYGAKRAPGRCVAHVTGHTGDVLPGRLVCWPASNHFSLRTSAASPTSACLPFLPFSQQGNFRCAKVDPAAAACTMVDVKLEDGETAQAVTWLAAAPSVDKMDGSVASAVSSKEANSDSDQVTQEEQGKEERRAALLRQLSSSRVPQPSKSLKLMSWNVNGLRAVLGKQVLLQLIENEAPCVLCLQEIKIDLPALEGLQQTGELKLLLNEYGYHAYWNPAQRKGYSGTACFSKEEPLSVARGIGIPDHNGEGRVLTVEFPEMYVVNVYAPNSGEALQRLAYRSQGWDPVFQAYVRQLAEKKPVVVTGDLNVAHKDSDVKDPKKKRNKVAGFCDEERLNFGQLVGGDGIPSPELRAKKTALLGRPGPLEPTRPSLVDVYHSMSSTGQSGLDGGSHFTFFSYRADALGKGNGWRLDYFLTSPELLPRVKGYFARHDLWGNSDHVPIGLELDFPKLGHRT